MAQDIATLRAATGAAFGVNVFSPPDEEASAATVSAYAQALAAEAERQGVALGEPRFDNDAYEDKLSCSRPARARCPSSPSHASAPPRRDTVAALHARDIAVWVTVTNVAEGREAADVGADALVTQGTEAGGHRAYFRDDGKPEGVWLAHVGAPAALPSPTCGARGGSLDGPDIAAVLVGRRGRRAAGQRAHAGAGGGGTSAPTAPAWRCPGPPV